MSQAAEPIAYFASTFDEALSLAREARDYVAYQQSSDLTRMSPTGRLVASCESMRLTARLTQVIAWLLVQKAVHAGELSREQAAEPRHRLGGQKVCLSEGLVADKALPERLVDLLARSHGLYQRVARLDAMFDGTRT